ncbi:MAG TPA: hypothetical protein VEX62_06680 [Candidatus Limnocylindrales bacterium]|nr:hypothetical protein [Candidatus Limnocylindrales bacterium]
MRAIRVEPQLEVSVRESLGWSAGESSRMIMAENRAQTTSAD